jgi:FlaA1/EpsC-like NDP-sugar epimerase
MNRNGVRIFCIKVLRITLDLLTIAFLFSLFVYLRRIGNPKLPVEEYFKLWPFLFLFWIVFEKTGLYEGATIHSGAALGPIEEPRRLFYATTAIFISIGFANFFHRPNDYLFSRIVFISTYLSCLFFIPFNRFLFRKISGRLGFYGVPAVIIGSGETAAGLFKSMLEHSEHGLLPLGYFSDQVRREMPDAKCQTTLRFWAHSTSCLTFRRFYRLNTPFWPWTKRSIRS